MPAFLLLPVRHSMLTNPSSQTPRGISRANLIFNTGPVSRAVQSGTYVF